MVFQLLSVISVSREIYEPFKEVLKVFQWYFKAVKDVSVVFRDCFKEVKSISKVFQRRYVLLLLSSQLPEQKEGLFIHVIPISFYFDVVVVVVSLKRP